MGKDRCVLNETKKEKIIFQKSIDKRAKVWYNAEEKEEEQPFSPGRHERAWVDIENICGRNSYRAQCVRSEGCIQLPGRYFFIGGALLLAQKSY